MAVVTSIIPSSRRQGRFDLMVDGRPVATLSLEVVERLQLRPGLVFGAELATAVEDAAQALRTFDRALDMLALRGRSAAELRRALVRKGESPAHVDAAIARLVGAGLLDDAAYARQFVRAKMAGPGFSRRRIQVELAKRGVAREVVDAAIAEVVAEDEVDEAAVVERVAAKKARTLARLDPETRRRRLYAFLARRGYELDDVRRVIERLLDSGPS